MSNSIFEKQQLSALSGLPAKIVVMLSLLLLWGCATQPASVPDTSILAEIQSTIDEAVNPGISDSDMTPEEEDDLLGELIPSLSLDEELLAPVEERISVTSPNLPADVFFSSLVAETEYGIVISEDVDVNINLSLPNVTLEEAMDTVAEIYNLDITRRGNIFTVRTGGLRTRQFAIDYLNVQRQGSSSISVNQGGAQGGLGGGINSGVGGGLGGGIGGGLGGGIGGGLGGAGLGSGIGGGGTGGGGGGSGIQTSTSTDFWSDLETAIANLIGVQSGGGGGGGAAAGGVGQFGNISQAGARNQSTITEEGKSVLVQPLTGLVFVTAYPNELDRVEQFIAAAQESLRREVIIQIQFLEVVLNKGFQYALDFNTFGQQANNPITGSGAFDGTASGLLGSNNDLAAEFNSASSAGIEGIGNPLQFSTNFSDFDAVFRILQTRGTTQVISSPQLRVLNNQKAVFQDGDQEYFQTQANSTTVAGGNNTTTSENNQLEQFFSGISMDITPQISANGEITLHVHPIISAVDEQSKNIGGQAVPLARTSTREIDSVIKAANGKIVVLGGLAFERAVSDTAGIPGVSRIPVVGDALEQRQTQTVKSEFIILLKPIIANAEGDKKVLDESNERFRQINRSIDPFANN
ncbi:MAG: secretin N-terminal domain-containing protein [Gammaproteobacteria bacterium]